MVVLFLFCSVVTKEPVCNPDFSRHTLSGWHEGLIGYFTGSGQRLRSHDVLLILACQPKGWSVIVRLHHKGSAMLPLS